MQIEVRGTYYDAISTTAIDDSTWRHVAMTVDDATKTITVYVNGVAEATDADSVDWVAGSPDTGVTTFTVGQNMSNAAHVDGDIDELRIQSGARSASEIRSYFAANVADYQDTVDDWNTASPNDSVFGACLSGVSGAGANAVWTVNASCPSTDGAYWQGVGDTSGAANAKIAESTTSGTTTAQADVRFGFRTAANQPPGTYSAPITFEAVAPNV